MFKLDLEKAEEPEINCQHPSGHWKSKRFQKNIYFYFIDYTKSFDCVDYNKLWKILQEMYILDHLTCLLRNLSAGREATVRMGYETIYCFKIGKDVCQDCISSSSLFNVYAEYIAWNDV